MDNDAEEEKENMRLAEALYQISQRNTKIMRKFIQRCDINTYVQVELGSLLSGWRSNLQPASAREERQLAFPSRQTSTTASNNTSAARR